MADTCPLLGLSDDLLRLILDQIEADPDKLVNLDRRGYLSQESFAIPPPPLRDQISNIGHLRQTCRRLANLGVIHQYARVTTRFSQRGFNRLERIAGQRHLAKHVRKFSYLIPNFYEEGRSQVSDILPVFDVSIGRLDARNFDEKAAEQRAIERSQRDAITLRKAAAAFTRLQHVQILRVQDAEDAALMGYLRQHTEFAHLVQLRWPPACRHATKTLARALVDSMSPCDRFSSPMASGQSAETLSRQRFNPTLKSLAGRLTSLELHFDDGVDLDALMRGLSRLFMELFKASVNLQSIHIGFPSHRPVNLGLEEVFHNVQWRKLSSFGIQAWKLDADEIISLAQRHRGRLRGLRLRDVLLNDGSTWKEVLTFLHDDMPYLDWVSLRRIGYAAYFTAQWTGAEIPDDPPGGDSDSDTDEDTPMQGHRRASEGDEHAETFNEQSDDEASTAPSDEFDMSDPQAHALGFPQLSPITPTTPQCHCPPASTDFMPDDNGWMITNAQRKEWEKWVVPNRTKR